MRFKYPNVIDVALAASAPIYMTTFRGSERDFFFTAVTEVMVIFFFLTFQLFQLYLLFRLIISRPLCNIWETINSLNI